MTQAGKVQDRTRVRYGGGREYMIDGRDFFRPDFVRLAADDGTTVTVHELAPVLPLTDGE